MLNNLLLLLPEDNLTMFEQTWKELQNIFQKTERINYVTLFKQKGLLRLETEIIDTVTYMNIDTIVLFRHSDSFIITPEFLKDLKNRDIKVILFYFDDEMYLHSVSKYYSQIATGVITTDYYGSFYYEQIGVPCELYISGYSKESYFPMKIAKDIEVSFVGNLLKQDRKEYIDYLEVKGVKVETFGLGGKNGFLDETEFASVFSRSKINLNFTKTETELQLITKEDPLSLKTRQNKGRPIEIALCKGFCLSEYAYPLEKVFRLNEEIDTFLTKEQLYEKIVYYLNHIEQSEKIAQKAYDRALKEYEIGVYLPKVFKKLDKKISSHISYDDQVVYNKHFLFMKSQAFFRYFVKSLKFGMKDAFYVLERGLYPYKWTNFIGFLNGIIRIPFNIHNRFLVKKALKSKRKS